MTLDFENISENGFRKTKSPDPVKKIVNMNLRSFKPLWWVKKFREPVGELKRVLHNGA